MLPEVSKFCEWKHVRKEKYKKLGHFKQCLSHSTFLQHSCDWHVNSIIIIGSLDLWVSTVRVNCVMNCSKCLFLTSCTYFRCVLFFVYLFISLFWLKEVMTVTAQGHLCFLSFFVFHTSFWWTFESWISVSKWNSWATQGPVTVKGVVLSCHHCLYSSTLQHCLRYIMLTIVWLSTQHCDIMAYVYCTTKLRIVRTLLFS